MEARLISVIIVNWNGLRFLESCLNSLMAQTYAPVETIVVDNGSTDGSAVWVRTHIPDVRLIENNKNLGFGGGINVGNQASRGTYVMILNNDTRLDPHCLEELRRSIERDERYGACASKILLQDGGRIDAAGIVIYPDGLSIGRGRMEEGDLFDQEAEVFFASGGACLCRRQMLEDIGLFDEDFFAYAEDTDLGWRARLAGWRCIYAPKAVVHHLHSASSGTYSHLKAYLVERNRIWVAIKNFPFFLLLYGQCFTLWRYLWQAYGAFTGKGAAGRFTTEFSKTDLVKILVKAYLSTGRSLPSLLGKRKMVQRKRRIPNREVYGLFKTFGISARDIALRE